MAFSTSEATCLAMVLATSLRKMSPTTMPLTPPSGFLNAVSLPNLMPSNASAGTSLLAINVATRAGASESCALSRIGKRCSDGDARLRPIRLRPIRLRPIRLRPIRLRPTGPFFDLGQKKSL